MEWYWMGATLFAILVGFILIGVPVAFSLGLAGTVAVYLFLSPHMLMQLARIAFDVASTHLFIVAPLFVLMAGLVSQSDVAEKAFLAATKWMNRLPGPLAISTVASATLFSAISGSSPATAAAIGYTAVPEMLKHGYSKRLAVGTVAAGGTLGILIPPSVVMIIYGIITETSIGDLFAAGIIPGILLSLLLMLYVMVSCTRSPPVSIENTVITWSDRFAALKGIWAIVLLFIAVMGAIYGGIATPTEAAALGAMVALILTLPRQGMGLSGLSRVLVRTAQTTSMILLLIICGSFFGFVISALGIAHEMVAVLVEAQVSPWTVLIGYLVLLVILGTLMDPASMMVITLPLAFPVLKQLGFDPVWIGVLVTIAVEIGMITPPVGLNLFVLQGVVPREITTKDIALGALPFVGVLLFGLLLVLVFPGLATWLPAVLP
ncbi:MAG: TRAP transporter large permease subunit [Alphaproteobacteria bacterium]|nr:TRAP transporter large permease subunit [Alphaproteobacteria bacterium]MDX5369974.1 TRAP transporter large permease subunit [Alphaproteobacteria bacterium]MDX5464550.1 TRAP transporter large permease subunit [Alphaproteobacteria bacterium]